MGPLEFGYQGLPRDPETGLIYFRNRYYDPELGRFITADPKGYVDGPSMYAFEGDDPANGSDPMGLCFGALQKTAFCQAIAEGMNDFFFGDPVAQANHDIEVRQHTKEFKKQYHRDPKPDEPIYGDPNGQWHMRGNGQVVSNTGVIEPDRADFAIATMGMSAGASAALARSAGGGILRQLGAAGTSIADDTAGQVLGVNPSAVKNLATRAAKKLGGAYSKVPAAGGEVHHMPADSVSPLSTGKGPAIRMETPDHRPTASWGRSKEAQAYRAQQQELIKQGRFDEAQQMDIDDVRSLHGSKYDEHIRQMQEYTRTIDPKHLKPKPPENH